MRLAVLIVAVVVLGAGCSHIPGMGRGNAATTPQASPSGKPLAKAAGQLDAEVPMPLGFPTDVPVYPNSRLTAGASFTSTGQAAWGMEWESTDAAAKVEAYFQKQLNLGDWKLTVNQAPSGTTFAGAFARKSNSRDSGTIAVNADQGVTMIALSFLTSG